MTFVVPLVGCWSPVAPPAAAPVRPSRTVQPGNAVDELLVLMRDRLLLMHEVAKWKWNEGLPIADPDRERQLLADLAERGVEYGLHREQTTRFMAAQIEAGKLVQQADFVDWKRQGTDNFPEARDLKTDLRPRIDDLSGKLLERLAKISAAERPNVNQIEQRARKILSGQGIDDDVRRAAIRSLLAAGKCASNVPPLLDADGGTALAISLVPPWRARSVMYFGYKCQES